jgi:hypothetical protein
VNLLTKQVNIQGALLNALTAALQPLFIKDRMEQEWRERLSRIKNNPLSEKFCITFNLGLRANVVASISFSSGEFQRQPPLGEEILTNVLEVALKSIPIFGQIVGSLVSGSITAFFDWKKENLHATTAKLFSFINTELFCDRLSIEIAEFCTPLFEKGIVKNEKHAENLATNALAFVLYTMSRDDLVKLKGENPEMELRMQLGYFFIQSKLFEKYHKQFVEGVQGAEQQFISSSSSSNYVTPPQKVLTFSSAHVVSNKVFVQPALSPQEPISLVKTKNKKSRCLVM